VKPFRFLLVITALLACATFAQSLPVPVPLPSPTVTDAVLGLFVAKVLPILFTGLAGALTLLFAKLSQKAGAQAKESKLYAFGTRLAHFAEVVVHDLEVTLKPQLLKATEDGTLSAVEIGQLRATALERLKALLKQEGLDELQSVLGIGSSMVDTYLNGVLEKAVAKIPGAPPELAAMVASPVGSVTLAAVAPSQG
jgi:hypothetical protein